MKLSRNFSVLLSIALVGLLIFGYQIATADTASKTLVACSNSNTGDLRLAQSVCNSNETDITGDLLASEGLAGEPGTQGLDGKDGNDGKEGADGKNGVAGRDGTNGTNGSVGTTGAAGPVGATGATGAAGLDGTASNVGATGPAGPAGPAGPSVSSGVLFTPADLVPTGWSTIRTDVLLTQEVVRGYYKSVVKMRDGSSNPLISFYVPEMSDWSNAAGIKVTAYMTASASGNAKFQIGATGYALNELVLDPLWNDSHIVSLTSGQVSKVTRTFLSTDMMISIPDEELFEFAFTRRTGDAEDVNSGDVYLLSIIVEPVY